MVFDSKRKQLTEKLTSEKEQEIDAYRRWSEAKILSLRKKLETEYLRLVKVRKKIIPNSNK